MFWGWWQRGKSNNKNSDRNSFAIYLPTTYLHLQGSREIGGVYGRYLQGYWGSREIFAPFNRGGGFWEKQKTVE